MIKLIAVDMDGTLLDSAKNPPPGMDDVIRKLHRHGIRFIAASGRQYYNLLKIFRAVAGDVTFIADNGAMIFDGDRCVSVSEIPYAMLEEPVAMARSMPGVHPVLCGVKSAWIESREEELLRNAAMYYEKLEVVPDVLEAAKHDRICKIAAFDGNGSEHHSYVPLQKFSGRFMVTLSGEKWVDLMNPGVDKGRALTEIQNMYGASREETMAFGDYLNDVAMMKVASYSYAMANAHPDLKKLCNYETCSNDENGVFAALRKEFDFL